MKERNPAFEVVAEMESDVADIKRWAEVLSLLGSTPHMIEPGVLHVLSKPIMEISKRLDARWTEAFRIVAGRP